MKSQALYEINGNDIYSTLFWNSYSQELCQTNILSLFL